MVHVPCYYRLIPQLKYLTNRSLKRKYRIHPMQTGNLFCLPFYLKVNYGILKNKSFYHAPLLASSLFSCFVLHAFWKKDDSKGTPVINLVQKADELYEEQQHARIYELLYPERDSMNDEMLWRLARAAYEVSKNAKNNEERLQIIEEACGYALKAVKINNNNGSAHRWCAILIDSVWKYRSTKGRLEHSLEVRRHMEKAIEINPKDATSYYILGEWCYTFADLSWYQRQAASLIFSKPPSSTFEEALHYFEAAEKAQPNFYSMNFLLLGKTCLKLKQKDKAVYFLKKARDYQQKSSDDHDAYKEAVILLEKLGMNS